MIASVKAELGKPSSLQPDKGKVAIFVDCSPTAAPVFEVGLLIFWLVVLSEFGKNCFINIKCSE